MAEQIGAAAHRLSYRFLFIPGTIGTITWLARNEDKISNIGHGVVLAGLGDSGGITYKRSRQGDAEIDRAASHVLEHSGQPSEVLDFDPYGYDERQFCSPGFNLPVGRLSRTPYGTYPEYHTSADNLDFISPDSLEDSHHKLSAIIDVLEGNHVYVSMNPKCEPQLGKRGLYSSLGDVERAMLWVLNLSDGDHDLLEIAERSGLGFADVEQAAARLVAARLLRLHGAAGRSGP
jgi:aminopeptidase-like protein